MGIPGTIEITGLLAPSGIDDTYAVFDAIYGIDGLRSVADHTTRDAIPTLRRREGMVVYTQNDGDYWKLASDLTTWNPFGGGSVTSITAGIGLTGGTITTSGTIALANPSSSSLGGTQSITTVAHNFLTGISTSGIPSQAQPAFTDISGTITTSQVGDSQITYAKIQNETAHSLLGNPTGSGAAPSEITLGAGLAFSGTTLTASGGGGGVTSITAGIGLTGGIITTSGTIALANPTASTLGGIQSAVAVTHQWINSISTSGVPSQAQPAFTDISGTVAAAQLPNPTASTLGGIQSITVVAHNFLTGISTSGIPSQAQPAFTDISGTVAATQLPNPTASTLGGIQSIVAVSHQWINSISTSGVPTLTQPAFTDISGAILTAQITSSNVTYAKIQNEGAHSLLGNPTGSSAAPSEITLGTGLSFSGTTLTATGGGGGLPSGTAGQILITDGTTPTFSSVIEVHDGASPSALGANSIVLNAQSSFAFGVGSQVSGSLTVVTGDNCYAEGVSNYAGPNSYTCSVATTGGVTVCTITGVDQSGNFSNGGLIWLQNSRVSGTIATVTFTGGNTVITLTTNLALTTTDTIFEPDQVTAAHAEGSGTIASGPSSHAEGATTIASGNAAHAEGNTCTASGLNSHAEGENTTAPGEASHAEGFNCISAAQFSHAEGVNSTIDAAGYACHAEGGSTIGALGYFAHAEGISTANGTQAHAEGGSNASGTNSHAEGGGVASGFYSHAEGQQSVSLGDYSHAGGYNSLADLNTKWARGDIGQYATEDTGPSQSSILQLSARTADATPANLTIAGGVGGSPVLPVIRNNSTYGFIASIVGRGNSGTDHVFWMRKGLIHNEANTVSIAGTVPSLGTDTGTTGGLAWGLAITADNTGKALQIQVTGAVATIIHWSCKLECVEVG